MLTDLQYGVSGGGNSRGANRKKQESKRSIKLNPKISKSLVEYIFQQINRNILTMCSAGKTKKKLLEEAQTKWNVKIHGG